LVEKHCRYTNSSRAQYVLDQWREIVGKFVKVMPIDYRKALERMKEAQARHDEFTPATEEVYNG
jgi:glutamate synthase domain-containing protein 3